MQNNQVGHLITFVKRASPPCVLSTLHKSFLFFRECKRICVAYMVGYVSSSTVQNTLQCSGYFPRAHSKKKTWMGATKLTPTSVNLGWEPQNLYLTPPLLPDDAAEALPLVSAEEAARWLVQAPGMPSSS